MDFGHWNGVERIQNCAPIMGFRFGFFNT